VTFWLFPSPKLRLILLFFAFDIFLEDVVGCKVIERPFDFKVMIVFVGRKSLFDYFAHVFEEL
jgi:hypothetical protein